MGDGSVKIHPPSKVLLNTRNARCEAFLCYIAATTQKIGVTAVLAVPSSIFATSEPKSDKEELFKGMTNFKP
jgi:hypothetical protein